MENSDFPEGTEEEKVKKKITKKMKKTLSMNRYFKHIIQKNGKFKRLV